MSLPSPGTVTPPAAAERFPVRHQLLERRRRLAAAADPHGQVDLAGLLAQVDSALERLASDDFGICTACDAPIEDDRLLADPTALVCLDCLDPEERGALERDLETAAAVQAALLPDRSCEVAGWQIRYHYAPLGIVSGDHCDLIRPEGTNEVAYFLFGDVAGKGVAAALLMSHLQALFRSLVSLELPLDEILRRANRLFCQSTAANSFATLVAGRFDRSGGLEVSIAGHCPPLVVRQTAVTTLPSTGLPLGIFADGAFSTHRLRLEPDDLLCLYTDGLTESVNEQGEEYGAERLAARLGGAHGRAPEAVVEAGLADLHHFRNGTAQQDDLTLMVLRRAAA